MLHQIYLAKSVMLAAGLGQDLDRRLHRCLEPIRKSGRFKVELRLDGSYDLNQEEAERYPLLCYRIDQRNTALSITVNNTFNIKTLNRQIDHTIQLAARTQVKPLLLLAEKLAVLNREVFLQVILDPALAQPTHPVVFFENSVGEELVHSVRTYDAISERLKQLDQQAAACSGVMDSFGCRGNSIKPGIQFSVPGSKYKLVLFGRNPDNKANNRFGLTGSEGDDASVVVSEAFAQSMSSACNALFSRSTKHTSKQKGNWYTYSENNRTHLVFSSLSDLNVLDGVTHEAFTVEEYQEEVAKSVLALRSQEEQDPCATSVLFILRLEQGRSQQVYCKEVSIHDLNDRVALWQEGALSGFRFLFKQVTKPAMVPNIRLAYHLLNMQFKYDSKSKTYKCMVGKSDPHRLFSIGDCYDLFMGDDHKAKRMLRSLCRNWALPLIDQADVTVTQKGKTGVIDSHELRSLVGLFNILHSVCGKDMNDTSRSPAFLFGVLCARVDILHRRDFRKRGLTPPDRLAGNQVVKSLRSDHRLQFAFNELMRRAERYGTTDDALPYLEAVSELNVAAGGKPLPQRLTEEELAEVNFGFAAETCRISKA